MKEKCLKKLTGWFGGTEFEYVILKETENECIFITICEGYEKNERNLEIYRIFKVGDLLEISCDLENYIISLNRDSSILTAIQDVIKIYDRVR